MFEKNFLNPHFLENQTSGERSQSSSESPVLASDFFFMWPAKKNNARFMFVNTNPLFDKIFDQMTKKIHLYNPNQNTFWRTGGFLTNSRSLKKFRSRNKKLCFAPPQPSDCVVILDTKRKSSVVLEANRLQISVQANDSVQFVYLFCNLITKTFLEEQKRFAKHDSIDAADDSSKIENSYGN